MGHELDVRIASEGKVEDITRAESRSSSDREVINRHDVATGHAPSRVFEILGGTYEEMAARASAEPRPKLQPPSTHVGRVLTDLTFTCIMAS